MKSSRFRFAAQFLATAVAWLAITGCQSVPEATPAGAGARVAEVQGLVRCRDADHPWRKLSAGNALNTGDLLQTALTSAVDVAVDAADGTGADRILLQSDTVLFVEGLPGAPATGGDSDNTSLKLHLRQGELTFTSPPSGKGSLCEIRLATGLAGARGATFNLRSDGELKVFRGMVALKSWDDTPARTVPAGNQYDPQTGELAPIRVGDRVAPLAPQPAPRPLPPQWPSWPTRKY